LFRAPGIYFSSSRRFHVCLFIVFAHVVMANEITHVVTLKTMIHNAVA
jgi:hypothetical protein